MNRYFLCFFLFSAFLSSHLIYSSQNNSKTKEQKILFLGDSITAGYGLSKQAAYPYVLEENLKKEFPLLRALNGGLSGSTSKSGVSRLKWYLKAKPSYVVIALGANDGLRGFKVTEIEKNLNEIIDLAQKNNIKILLAGMRLPKNYGLEYTTNFEAVFSKIAKDRQVLFMPFLLKDVAKVAALNQVDGIHPNEKGQIIIAKNIAAYIKKLLK